MEIFKSKKGQSFDFVKGAAIAIVVIAITISMGATILTQQQSTITNTTSTAYNASGYGLTSLQTLGQWLPTIALVVAAVVVIGFIGFLGSRAGR